MATDYEDSPVIEGITVQSKSIYPSAEIEVGWTAIEACLATLSAAQNEGKIKFAPNLTGTILEVIALMLMRAAHTKDEDRMTLFSHWITHGPEMVEKLIESVEGRQDQMLMPQDLASMFMGKPPGY